MGIHIIKYIQFLSIMAVFFSCHEVFGAEVVPGNSKTADTSFSFALQEHVSDEKTGRLFVAAAPQAGGAQEVQDFSLSMEVKFDNKRYRFEPLTPELVHLNGSKEKVPNPLFDAGIEHIGLISGDVIQNQSHPIVVKSDEPSSLYFFESITPPKVGSLVWIPFVLDANGQINGGIVGLSQSAPNYAFAAVKPYQSNVFGQQGSGIAVLVLGTSEIDVQVEDVNAATKEAQEKSGEVPKGGAEKDSIEVKDQEKKSGEVQIVKKTVLNLGAINGSALPFDTATEQLIIGNDLAGMGQIVDIHWDSTVGRVYIALQITTGPQAADGGRALVVGRVQNTTSENNEKKVVTQRVLILEKIAPDDAFTNANNSIVGTLGAGAQVSLHKVRTMLTSTGLRYVVVVGGNGNPGATKRSVYALPIVSNSSRASNNGTLASKNAVPVDEFQTEVPYQFIRRDIKQPALTQADMFVATDAAALVGAGTIDAGDIADIFVRGDAVFVTVGNPANPNEEPGIFYSQAIFDELSMVKAWTAWRRVAGTTNEVFGGTFDAVDGTFAFMTNNDDGTVNTVKRTVWSNGAQDGLFDLNKVITQELPLAEGGIQGLVDLPANSPGLHDISLMMVTGRNKVVLVESGQVINNVLHPLQGAAANNTVAFNDGTITTTLPLGVDNPKVVSIAGGVLDTVGPLTAAEVAIGAQGWLFVGGTKGLAVLSKDNGDGWNLITGLGPDFAGLEAGMAFKLIPNYSFVRKLVQDGNFLYVLTDKKLDRIDLTQDNIGLGQAATVTIAEHTSIVGPNSFFADCIVSGKFAVIATGRGLMRVGNGKNVSEATSADDVGWTSVSMPEGVKGIRQLLAISRTGTGQDVARNDGGQIYALNVDRGTNRSDVTRFAINSVENSEIDDMTVTPFSDFYVKDFKSFRINFGGLRTVFSTDGALYLNGHGIDLEVKPAVNFPRDSVLSRFAGVRQASIPLALDGGSHITNMVRSFASGSWLISGDFGLRINE